MVDDYGFELGQLVPEQLRTMVFAVIPEETEVELEHPMNAHIQTPEQIVEFCKAKTVKSRQKLLAAQKLKILSSPTASGRMSPLTEPPAADPSEPIPSWAEPLIAAIK